MITKIISGGQTGADRGGLDAAIHCDWPHGGWCPKGHTAEDGVIPAQYHLNEMASPDYLPRTKANVFDSDATIIFTYGPPKGGSLKTATYAHHLKKPWHEVDLLRTTQKQATIEIMRWLAGDEELNDYDEYVAFPPPLECILNVAGSRESQAPGIQEAVFQLMVDVLIKVNITSNHFQQLRHAGRPQDAWGECLGRPLPTQSGHLLQLISISFLRKYNLIHGLPIQRV